VHGVHPVGVQLDAVDDRSHGLLVREDPDLAVEGAHLLAEILVDDRRLRAELM
jgi:hypothetical protein